MGRRRPGLILAALAALLALVTAACGGGDGGGTDQAADPLDEPIVGGERAVQVTGAGKVRLAGTFTTPAQARERMPGVLIVPSLSMGDRDGLVPSPTEADRIGRDLATAFADGGLASYRYDRRGTGESKLEAETRLSFDDLVADARAGIDLLAQRKETAGSELAVAAYDLGGLVALRLAATDDRVKRVVLVSTPGRPVAEVQAAELAARYGPESGDALRAAVGNLLATRTVPPLDTLRSELRPLFPPAEGAYLIQLYSLDPAAEAAKVGVPVLVVGGGPSRLDAERLAAALGPRAELTLFDNLGRTLQLVTPATGEDRSQPSSASHDHGAAPPQAMANRDRATLDRIAGWLAGGGARRPA